MSHYTWAAAAWCPTAPPGGMEELTHVHPLRGCHSATGEPSYTVPVTYDLLHSHQAPDSHSPLVQ